MEYSLNPEKSNVFEKRRRYELAQQEVERITDGLGKPIDENMKETVAILNAMGVPTDSSCAGHKSQEEGFGKPYIRIYAPEPDGWKEDMKAREKWTQENLRQRARIESLLNQFNGARKSIEETILVLRNIGGFGAFSIECDPNTKFKTVEEAVEKITLYQKEMNAFTEFLKQEYFRE